MDPKDIARLITEDPNIPNTTLGDVKQKVAEWNARYQRLSKAVRLKDLDSAEYEVEVGSELLDVCGEDKNLALAVFNHPDNKGGWMTGDVARWLRNQN